MINPMTEKRVISGVLYRMAIPSMRSQVIPKKIPIPPMNRISIYQSFLGEDNT
jgi:hypothetical protein